jgi:hypothetical protein
MKQIFTIITMSFLLSIWCGSTFATEIGYGEIEGGVYKNDYFNMYIEVPKGWAVQSQAALKELTDRGGELLVGDDENLKALLNASDKQTVRMFGFFKYEQGAPVDFNPSVTMAAECVSNFPGIKRGSDYLFHVKKGLQAIQLQYSFPKEMYTKDISGVSFDVMPAEISLDNSVFYQEYYSARIKDYVLTFTLTYSNELEIDELNQVVGKMKFTK